MALRPSPDRHVKDDYPWWLVELVAIGLVLAAVIVTNDI
ncbi:amino acid ABC transporter permease, partial [Rhizobium ruizarguesonis]